MVSKFELAISTSYVPDWGVVEAFRELFQNALDNETTTPENKMYWNYENGTVTIGNKTSKLETESLLLGCGTKANDENTIGKHGEGYKIAFMVLLRNNKKIKVYNYGAREIWEVRLVKSKRYNNNLVTTVFIDKEPVWKKIPDSNLTIEVEGITEDEYREIVKKNLNLRQSEIKMFRLEGIGGIILNEEEAGNIYVKGLYVSHINNMVYGYNFEPKVLSLDRDRKLVDSFNVCWESSIIWQYAAAKSEIMRRKAVKMLNNKSYDTQYVSSNSHDFSKLANALACDFVRRYGEKAVPVSTTEDYENIRKVSEYKPVIVSERIAGIINSTSVLDYDKDEIRVPSLVDRFNALLDKIEDRLTDEELQEFQGLIAEIDD